MAETKEVELKLELAAQAADALEAADLFREKLKVAKLRSVYFDTSDHQLAAAGLSLRIRRAGRTRIQTVKAAPGSPAGLFARPEWECKVKGDTPVLDDSTPIQSLLGRKVSEVVPVFEVHVERRTWNVIENGTSVEVVLDRGTVVAGDRQSPICEVELELKEGSAGALFVLARKIDAIAEVRLGVLSKSERGYRLLGPVAGADTAEAVSLNAGMTAATMFQHIARSAMRHFRLNETLLLENRDAAALHEARVALRRLRSALSIHRLMLGDHDFDRLRAEVGWLASELGDARNLDVLLKRKEVGPVRARLVKARAIAYAAAEAAIASDRARALMIDLAEWIALGAWLTQAGGTGVRNEPATDYAAKELDRLRRQVKRRGRGLPSLDDGERHELRKAAKKLRYAAEFFAALFKQKRDRRRRKRFVAALEDVQNQLGALNDLATAPLVLEGLGMKSERQLELVATNDAKGTLIKAAAAAYDDLIQGKTFWR